MAVTVLTFDPHSMDKVDCPVCSDPVAQAGIVEHVLNEHDKHVQSVSLNLHTDMAAQPAPPAQPHNPPKPKAGA